MGHGLRPKKRLGQHFLRDRGTIDNILNLAGFEDADQVVEIGAGLGALTIPLAQRVHRVLAIEKDMRFVPVLAEKLSFKGLGNVALINDDILELDFHRLMPSSGKRITIIGNLPYNISSPFLEKLFKNKELINRAVLMFQAELAGRLIAVPGSKAYGALTIITRYHAEPSPLLEVPKEVFYPQPKINSMVLELDFNRPYPKRIENEKVFMMIVKGAFSHRRKTLSNSLKRAGLPFSHEDILKSLEKCAIDEKIRAESLNIN